jgi:hypothetical protein
MKQHDSTPLAYSIPGLCQASGLGRTFIYSEIKAGALEATKVGKRTIITRPAAERWMDRLARKSR